MFKSNMAAAPARLSRAKMDMKETEEAEDSENEPEEALCRVADAEVPECVMEAAPAAQACPPPPPTRSSADTAGTVSVVMHCGRLIDGSRV